MKDDLLHLQTRNQLERNLEKLIRNHGLVRKITTKALPDFFRMHEIFVQRISSSCPRDYCFACQEECRRKEPYESKGFALSTKDDVSTIYLKGYIIPSRVDVEQNPHRVIKHKGLINICDTRIVLDQHGPTYLFPRRTCYDISE